MMRHLASASFASFIIVQTHILFISPKILWHPERIQSYKDNHPLLTITGNMTTQQVNDPHTLESYIHIYVYIRMYVFHFHTLKCEKKLNAMSNKEQMFRSVTKVSICGFSLMLYFRWLEEKVSWRNRCTVNSKLRNVTKRLAVWL